MTGLAQEVIAKVGLWWPAADEGKLREAADAWRQCAGSLDGIGNQGSAAMGPRPGEPDGR